MGRPDLAGCEARTGTVGYFYCAKCSVNDSLQTPTIFGQLQRAHRYVHVHEIIGILTLAHTCSAIVSDDADVVAVAICSVELPQTHMT